MIGKVKRLLRKHWFNSLVFIVVLVAVLFRFINYDSRWGFASDQARDAIIGKYAIENFKFPLVGSFSSAGPFQTGAQWYWFVMVGTATFHNLFLGPWIFLGLTYVASVILMIFMGKILLGGKFGILVGIFSAVSTAEIVQSTNLTNPSLLSVFSLLSILFAVLYVKAKRPLYLFFLAFFVSFGIGIHLQGVSLLFLIILTLLLTGFPSKNGIMALLLGLLIPMVPFLLYEGAHNFFNTRNMAQYYFHDQYGISFEVLGRRWLTYIASFLPQAWSHILGGFTAIGCLSMLLVSVVVTVKSIKRSISKEWVIIIVSLFLSLFIMRYARAPLYYGYMVFLHPFIIVVTGWAVYLTYKYNKIIGIILFGIIIIGSCCKNYSEIINAENYTAYKAREWSKLLVKLYPNDSFAIYDFGYKTPENSLPLVLLLYREGKISDSGRRIGFGSSGKNSDEMYPEIRGRMVALELRNLQGSSSTELQKTGWFLVNPKMIYNNTVNWQ